MRPLLLPESDQGLSQEKRSCDALFELDQKAP